MLLPAALTAGTSSYNIFILLDVKDEYRKIWANMFNLPPSLKAECDIIHGNAEIIQSFFNDIRIISEQKRKKVSSCSANSINFQSKNSNSFRDAIQYRHQSLQHTNLILEDDFCFYFSDINLWSDDKLNSSLDILTEIINYSKRLLHEQKKCKFRKPNILYINSILNSYNDFIFNLNKECIFRNLFHVIDPAQTIFDIIDPAQTIFDIIEPAQTIFKIFTLTRITLNMWYVINAAKENYLLTVQIKYSKNLKYFTNPEGLNLSNIIKIALIDCGLVRVPEFVAGFPCLLILNISQNNICEKTAPLYLPKLQWLGINPDSAKYLPLGLKRFGLKYFDKNYAIGKEYIHKMSYSIASVLVTAGITAMTNFVDGGAKERFAIFTICGALSAGVISMDLALTGLKDIDSEFLYGVLEGLDNIRPSPLKNNSAQKHIAAGYNQDIRSTLDYNYYLDFNYRKHYNNGKMLRLYANLLDDDELVSEFDKVLKIS